MLLYVVVVVILLRGLEFFTFTQEKGCHTLVYVRTLDMQNHFEKAIPCSFLQPSGIYLVEVCCIAHARTGVKLSRCLEYG